MRTILLKWARFDKMTEARHRFKKIPCIYVQTDKKGNVIRVGKAGRGLEARYRGGTGYALDAAMYASGNKVYVAKVIANLADIVERELIWCGRAFLHYNNQGKKTEPKQRVGIIHKGDYPNFRG